MPMYEYRCTTCKVTTEELRPVAARDEQSVCMACGNPIYRMVSETTFILKGRGWAKDGYNK